MSSLDGRVAMVTGGSSGIGRAVALACSAAGATVLVVGRDQDRLAAAIADARPTGRLVAIRSDLADDDAVHALATTVEHEHGSLDILVHAAGDIAFGRLMDAAVDDLDRLHAVNLRAPYLLTQALLPFLVRARGHIVFVNSSAGIRPSAGVAAYGATKHALRGLADALRDEVNPLGVRVTSIYPGRTRTPLQEQVNAWEGRDEPADLLDPEDIASMVVALVTLPDRAEVTELRIRPAYPPRDEPVEGQSPTEDGHGPQAS